MLHQRFKDIAFYNLKIFSYILYPYYRLRFFNKSDLLLHIGSGKNKIFNWLNMDGNLFSKPDILWDIRNKFRYCLGF